MPVSVRYFAGARAAAGVAEEQVSAATLGDLRQQLTGTHGAGLAQVLATASFLVNGLNQQDPAYELPADATVDVLPPFAGG